MAGEEMMSDKNVFPTRRDFFKFTAAGAVGAFGAPYIVPSSVLGSNAPSNRITIGCIGNGNIPVNKQK